MIYLDNAATTKVYDSSIAVFSHFSSENYFNPSALYGESVSVSKSIKIARENIMRSLHAPDGDLIFLSGGTEADNTALFCTRKARGSKIIVSIGEHDAIINSTNELRNQGHEVVFAPIKTDGSVDEDMFATLLDENVSLVSVMHVSNETGAVNDIKKLVKITRKLAPNAIFHSDGVQAFGKINVNLRALDVDLYSISGHKIHAPKGVGGLYVKKGLSIKPLLYGGGQEKGMRSGTENVPLIMAFDDAIKANMSNFDANCSQKRCFIEYLKEKLVLDIPNTVVITPDNAVPHILTVAFDGVRGEVLLHTLEKYGILVGIGSACSSHHESRFKSLLGLDEAHKDGIVRFSASEFNTQDEIQIVVDAIKTEIAVLKSFHRV